MRNLTALIIAPILLACTGDAFSGADSGDDADLPGDAQADGDGGTKLKYDASDASDSTSQNDGEPSGDASDGGGTTGPRRVFVTFESYDIGSSAGQFKGVAQADAICQAHATAAALGGTWKAWLSSSAGSVASRFTHTGGPFKLIDGTVIANDWSELTSGTLKAKPSEDENGNPLTDQWVWTGTLFDGTLANSTCPDAGGSCAPCNDWTSANTNEFVQFGKSQYTDGRWSGADAGTMITCNSANGLYCFEQ
jgi:hypothetical protein